ncbi:MAG: DUF72 domain-containing protein [Thermoanaerobaculia bacterium]
MNAPELLAGTSGFSYKEWKGPFYPEDLPAAKMLAYYAEHLPAVEINNTFYRMPKREVLATWAGSVPGSFRFSIKASRRITHFKRLKECGEEIGYLAGQLEALGDRLGVVLFQLPPQLAADLERLRTFLAELPADLPAAFEFRHPSWFDAAVLDALRERGCPLCVADTEEGEDAPLEATADWGYLRLRRPDYDDEALAAWARRLGGLGWKRAFVFFKHEDEGAGPRMAARFLELAREG